MTENFNSNNNLKSVKHDKGVIYKRIYMVLLKHFILVGFAFLLAGFLIVITMNSVIMPIIIKSGREIDAPDLIGKTFEEAEDLIKGNNFTLLADSTEYNNDFQANTILFQYPSSDTKIKPGRRIRVIVSRGARPKMMPDVIGKPRRDAELIIKAAGFNLAGQEWIHSNDFIKGIVARQYPEGDNDVPEDTEVVLYISDGLPETDVIMPSLIKMGLSNALNILNECNFDTTRVNIQYEEAPNLLPETVIDQYPDPGTLTYIDVTVVLIVSTSQLR